MPAQNGGQRCLKVLDVGEKILVYGLLWKIQVINQQIEKSGVAFSVPQCLATEIVPLKTTGVFLQSGITAPK